MMDAVPQLDTLSHSDLGSHYEQFRLIEGIQGITYLKAINQETMDYPKLACLI